MIIDPENPRADAGGLRTFKVVSYFTPDYEPEATRLQRSLADVIVNPHGVREIDGMGAWLPNSRFLPIFLEQVHRHEVESTVWLEADSVVLSYPWAFNRIESDIGVVFRHGKPLSSVIYAAPSLNARSFLKTWATITKQRPEAPIDITLAAILGELEENGGLTIERLPETYAALPHEEGDDVVIKNMKAGKWKRGGAN